MVNQYYNFIIPLDQSQSLKVTLKVIDKQPATDDHSPRQNPIISTVFNEKNVVELEDVTELPDNIIQAINTAHATLAHQVSLQQSFMVSTATGFQLLRLYKIIYFEYLADSRQWIVLLTDHTQLSLKHNTTAENILSYSPDFIQINQQYIINQHYLVRIEGKACRLSVPSAHEDKLLISRSYLKGLQQKMAVI